MLFECSDFYFTEKVVEVSLCPFSIDAKLTNNGNQSIDGSGRVRTLVDTTIFQKKVFALLNGRILQLNNTIIYFRKCLATMIPTSSGSATALTSEDVKVSILYSLQWFRTLLHFQWLYNLYKSKILTHSYLRSLWWVSLLSLKKT